MTMRRSLVIAIALAVGLSAAACDGPQASAATVNGATISRSELMDNIAPYESAELKASPTLPADGVAAQLTELIYDEMFHQELERRRITVTDDDRKDAEQQVSGSLQQGQTLPEGVKAAAVRRTADVIALVYSIIGGRTNEAEFAKNGNRYICAQVVLAADEASARTIAAQAARGADFTEIASDPARNQSPDLVAAKGVAGCALPESGSIQPALQEALEKLAVNEVSGPVSLTGTGQTGAPQQAWVVVKRIPATPEMLPPPQQRLQSQARTVLTQLREDLAARGKVTVNPLYGRWKRYDSRVDPVSFDPSTGQPTPYYPDGTYAVIPFVPTVMSRPTVKPSGPTLSQIPQTTAPISP